MKTLLLVLMPLLMFSGCVHKVPAGHTIASRHTIPVYLKVGVVKKEHTHNHVGGKKLEKTAQVQCEVSKTSYSAPETVQLCDGS